MTMLEKVARALWDSLEGDVHSGGGWDFGSGRMNVSNEQKERFRKMAHAALTAMLEPTEAMKVAGSLDPGAGGPDRGYETEVWQAMIRAAIDEHEKETP